jgi:polar amino acid transport system substrate-binding protein
LCAAISKCLVGFVLALCFFQCAFAEVPRELRVCGDASEWPPYDYFVRDGLTKSEAVAGFDVDILNAILDKSGRHATYRLLPWKRCLALAALGQFDVILDIIKIPVREHDFVLTNRFYSVTPVAIYSKARPIPRLFSAKDLSRLHQCELFGTVNAALIEGVGVELGRPESFDAAAGMLKVGRCQVLIFDLEVVRGIRHFSGGGDIFNEQEFGIMPLPWVAKIDLFFGVSRSQPYRDELVKLLNRDMEDLTKSGDADRIRQRYELR